MRACAFGWLLLGGVALVGCSPSGDNPTNVIQVQGKALAPDGKAARWVTLTFYPTAPGGASAVGSVDGDGKFTPKTLNNQEGILPGPYKVTVESVPNKSDATKVDPKYKDESSTDITVEVKPGDKEVTVQLK